MRRGVYALDVGTVSTGAVAATLVVTRSAMPAGAYSDFIVTTTKFTFQTEQRDVSYAPLVNSTTIE